MKQNFIVLLLIFTMVLELPFQAFAGYEAEKLAIYPMLKTISIVEKYKDNPQELFLSGELKNHPFATNLRELLMKEGVKKLPRVSRSGYSLVVDDGSRKISIFSKYAHVGVLLIDGKVFSLRDYTKFQDVQKGLEAILNKKVQTSYLSLFFSKAEAQSIPEPRRIAALAIIALVVFAFGSAVELMRVLSPEVKDFVDKECVEGLKKIDPENLPANEQNLRKLISAYNGKVNELGLRLGKRPEVILDHAEAVKVLEDLRPADCSQIDDNKECEKLKIKYEESRRLALKELNKASSQRLKSSSANQKSPVSLGNVVTIKDCLKLYDKYFWEVFSKMPESERKKVKLYVDSHGYLDMEEKRSNEHLKVPPADESSTGVK